MASLTLVNIATADDKLKNFPALYASNNAALVAKFNEVDTVLNSSTKTLSLTTFLSLTSGQGEMSMISLTGTGGVLSVNPGGTGSVANINSDGTFTAVKFVASSTDELQKSTFGYADFSQDVTISGAASLDGKVAMGDGVSYAETTIDVADANCGAGATNKVDLSSYRYVFLNYNNSGSALSDNAELNIDTANMVAGQVITLVLLGANSSGQKLYNGTSGSEIFAYADSQSAGFVSVADSVKPEFTSGANTRSSATFMWKDIGGGNMRFVVINEENTTGLK